MRLLARRAAANPLPTAFCHGASLLPRPDGTVFGAWFGGTEEGLPDSGIYFARLGPGGETWDPPRIVSSADGHPCGNPVLCSGAGEEIWLLYFRVWGAWCTGGKPCARISSDGGWTWGPEALLLDRTGVLTKNKPLRMGGELLLPVYDERRWQVGIARLDLTGPSGRWWFDDLSIGAGSGIPMIQGTIAETTPGRLLMLMRTKAGRIWQVDSDDAGATWSPPHATTLRNPNAGIDMVRLPDGRLWLCFNDTDRGRDPVQWDLRYPLCLAESTDGGGSWRNILTLETGPGEYSYPAIITDPAGLLHVAYTALRKEIRHVLVEP